jgi:hypothetical protein
VGIGLRKSRGANTGTTCSAVNEPCHGWIGTVEPDDPNHVMKSPRVFAIYWDEYFDKNPEARRLMDKFFADILGGTESGETFMAGLEQYGVGKGKFLDSIVVTDPPSKAELTSDDIQAELKKWIKTREINTKEERSALRSRTPVPRRDPYGVDENETNLLFVIFTPNKTNIGGADKDCVCGYHGCGLYNKTSGDPNLFWAAIQEWHHGENLPSNEREFVNSCTWCVSHEMVEAFTNRDGKGFHVNDCEIGDICECGKGADDAKAPIIKTLVGEWWVETYWDNDNGSCYPLHIVPANTKLAKAKRAYKKTP